MEQCYKDAESFYNPVDKCLANGNSNTTAACSCFDGLDLDALLAKVTACDLSDDNNAVKKEKTKCKKSKTSLKLYILCLFVFFKVSELARLHR